MNESSNVGRRQTEFPFVVVDRQGSVHESVPAAPWKVGLHDFVAVFDSTGSRLISRSYWERPPLTLGDRDFVNPHPLRPSIDVIEHISHGLDRRIKLPVNLDNVHVCLPRRRLHASSSHRFGRMPTRPFSMEAHLAVDLLLTRGWPDDRHPRALVVKRRRC